MTRASQFQPPASPRVRPLEAFQYCEYTEDKEEFARLMVTPLLCGYTLVNSFLTLKNACRRVSHTFNVALTRCICINESFDLIDFDPSHQRLVFHEWTEVQKFGSNGVIMPDSTGIGTDVMTVTFFEAGNIFPLVAWINLHRE